jgi:outer membrane protein
VQATDLDLILGIEEAHAGVLAAQEVVTATHEALRRALVHRDFARAGVRQELRAPIDLTRAEADVANLEVSVVRGQGSLREARAILAAAIGAEALEVDAVAGPVAGAGELSAGPGLAAALDAALTRNPAAVAALARITRLRFARQAAERETLPRLYLAGGVSGAGGGALASNMTHPYGEGWLPAIPNWYAGLVITWDVFDPAARVRWRTAMAREAQAKDELASIRLEVRLAVQRAAVSLEEALRALPSLDRAVKAARANLDQAEARFRAGLGNNVELADAEATLTSAQLNLAIGRYGVARARAQLGRAIGRTTTPAH